MGHAVVFRCSRYVRVRLALEVFEESSARTFILPSFLRVLRRLATFPKCPLTKEPRVSGACRRWIPARNKDFVKTRSCERPIGANRMVSLPPLALGERGSRPRDAAGKIWHNEVPLGCCMRGRLRQAAPSSLVGPRLWQGGSGPGPVFVGCAPSNSRRAVAFTPKRHRRAGPRVRATVSISSFLFGRWAQERFLGSWLRTFMSAISPGA